MLQGRLQLCKHVATQCDTEKKNRLCFKQHFQTTPIALKLELIITIKSANMRLFEFISLFTPD